MGHVSAERSNALSGLVREASARLGISRDRVETALRAAQIFSNEELGVVEELLSLVDSGISAQRRSALSRGVLKALEAVPAKANTSDPLAEVDDPMDEAEAVEALSGAEIEAQTLRQALLHDCVSASDAARTTGRSRQVLERLRRANRLIALRAGSQWRYPRWQFDPDAPGGILPGLDQVIRNLQLSPAGVAGWLLQPSKQLGGAKPLELLRRHQPAPVIELARDQAWMP